jgi:hypothetical protein
MSIHDAGRSTVLIAAIRLISDFSKFLRDIWNRPGPDEIRVLLVVDRKAFPDVRFHLAAF